MLYKVVGAATIGIASISVLTQLLLLPWLHQHTASLRAEFESRLRQFHHNARQFDDQLHRLGKLTGAGVPQLLRAAQQNPDSSRLKRQLTPADCPPAHPGTPGQTGEAGEDGESGDPGEDGSAGLDAITLLLQEAQKCVVCPQGPAGPIGAPGQQGYHGPRGDKGIQGESGTDGLDGEQGPEGLPGLPGIAGKPGKKGVPGAPAPGGTGPPGPIGVKGPLGQTGKQGERGRRNFVIGMPGLDGRSGKQGLDGLEGKPGQRGDKGLAGEDGADARFCPCPNELNKLGSGEKGRSHLAAPPGQRQPSTGSEQQQSSPKALSAAPPAPVQAPSAEEKKIATDQLQSSAQIGGPAPVKQSIATPVANAASNASANLRIAQLRSGEQPTTGKEAAAQIKGGTDYEEAYPNYEANEAGKRSKNGEDPKADTYDNELQLNGGDGGDGSHKGKEEQKQPEEGQEGTAEGGNNGAEDEQQQEENEEDKAPMSTRRFVYVTKRPRPKL